MFKTIKSTGSVTIFFYVATAIHFHLVSGAGLLRANSQQFESQEKQESSLDAQRDLGCAIYTGRKEIQFFQFHNEEIVMELSTTDTFDKNVSKAKNQSLKALQKGILHYIEERQSLLRSNARTYANLGSFYGPEYRSDVTFNTPEVRIINGRKILLWYPLPTFTVEYSMAECGPQPDPDDGDIADAFVVTIRQDVDMFESIVKDKFKVTDNFSLEEVSVTN